MAEYGGVSLPSYFGKPTDCVFGRYFHRRLSRPLTLLLLRTPVTPNQITLAAFIVSMFSILSAVTGTPAGAFWAGILFEIGTLLDNCDGEVARIKKMFSERGAYWDTLLDHIAYVTFYVAALIGVMRSGDHPSCLLWGIESAVAALLLLFFGRSVTSVYRKCFPPALVQQYSGYKSYLIGSSSPRLRDLLQFLIHLTQRGFLGFFFMLLGIFNKLHWLIIVMGIGINFLLAASLFLIPWIYFAQARRSVWQEKTAL